METIVQRTISPCAQIVIDIKGFYKCWKWIFDLNELYISCTLYADITESQLNQSITETIKTNVLRNPLVQSWNWIVENNN